MPEFPASPMSPKQFLEEWVPSAFSEVELPQASREVTMQVGVLLEGDEGGEWVLHLEEGDLRVDASPRQEAAFTIVQTVEDWRGALWHGRGGVFGRQALAIFRPGEEGPAAAGTMGGSLAPSPAALEQMRALDGLIRMVVSGGEGGDWAVGFKLGPGAIPEEATTTITISAEDAAAMERGELDPMQAFMAGRIQVAGDMALMMQMQAIQMQAAMAQEQS